MPSHHVPSGLLVVARHAKAEQHAPTDAERPLAERGLGDAFEAGRWLAEQGFTPDVALVSAALRTRQTWERMSEGAGWAVEPSYDRGLYTAGPENVLDLVHTVPDDTERLLVVGHNPTMAYLAQLLHDGDGEPAAMDALMHGFPTSALAVLEVPVPWDQLALGDARLVGYHRP